MSRALHTRLARLEAAHTPKRRALQHVVQGATPGVREAHAAELVRSGLAVASDCFILTGVNRAPPSSVTPETAR